MNHHCHSDPLDDKKPGVRNAFIYQPTKYCDLVGDSSLSVRCLVLFDLLMLLTHCFYPIQYTASKSLAVANC